MYNNKFDDIAKKIVVYLNKNKQKVNKKVYNEAKHNFIEHTMSCDAGEVLMYAKMFFEGIIAEKTTVDNRVSRYSEYLAVYDVYRDVKASI